MKHIEKVLLAVAFSMVLAVSMLACGGGGGDTSGVSTDAGGGGSNNAPVANAGPDQNVTTGSLVTLDGSASSDPKGLTLTYAWAFTSKPTGSTAALSDTTIVNPTFTSDMDGSYVLSLVVNNGKVDSAADTVTITTSNLPDTGQTTSYTSTFGEDADYTIHPPSYMDNGDGTVTDNVTGLMWQQVEDASTYGWYEASGTYDATYNPASTDVCGSLSLAGYSDWRLPSKKELMSIVDYGTYSPAIDTTYFPNASSGWTSTSAGYYLTEAWVVSFFDGSVSFANKVGNGAGVRCVRGEQYPPKSFTDNGDGTVTDNVTGLMWQQTTGGYMNWESALTYCEGLSLAGYADWRLPNVKELASITDDTTNSPAIDSTYFQSATTGYWSSTTNANYPSNAWHVDFSYGYVRSGDPFYSVKTGSDYFRCVR